MPTMDSLLAQGAHVAELLAAQRATVAIAEASTGGLISAALLAVRGASAFYRGGSVIYTPRARHRLLGLRREDVRGLKSASEPYAALVAETVRHQFSATWGLSESGATGPSGNPYGDPAGHSCVAVAGSAARAATIATGHGDRWGNMLAFSSAALTLLQAALEAN